MSERRIIELFVKEVSLENKRPKGYAKAKIFNVLSTVLIFLLSAGILIGAVLFAFNTSPTKSIFGYRYYTVLTPSMSPSYNVGDVVFVHIEGPDNINVGDVITFNPSNDSEAYLTHRVSEKIKDYQNTGITCFKTKGDANNSEDGFLIDQNRVVGKVVFGIPGLGYVIRFVQLRWYMILAITAMIIVLICLLKYYFKDDKQKTDEPEDDAKKTDEPEDDAKKSDEPEDDAKKTDEPEDDAKKTDEPEDDAKEPDDPEGYKLTRESDDEEN